MFHFFFTGEVSSIFTGLQLNLTDFQMLDLVTIETEVFLKL